MRVTSNLMSGMLTKNLERSYARILDHQNTVSTGRRINKPSDDPIGIGNVLTYRNKISSIGQYGRNIQSGNAWLSTTDSTLDSINAMLLSAKELAVYQATETATETTRNIAAGELENIYDQAIQLANTSLGGRYLFAGQQTDTAPYSRDADFNASYAGDTGDIRIIIGENVDMVINTTGEDVFAGGVDLFEVLKDLKDGLENNDTGAIAAQIDRLGDAMGQIQNERAQVGARLNRLEATGNHWETFKLNIQEMMSETEDADLVTALTQLTAMETAYEAALAVTASIIQPNLMQYLR